MSPPKYRAKIEILPLPAVGPRATAYRITAITPDAVQIAIDRLTSPLNERSGRSDFYNPRLNVFGRWESCGFIEFMEPAHA